MKTTKHALIASYYVPQPALDSSSRRLLHFVEFLRKDGWEVTIAAKNLAGSDRVAALLRQQGVGVYSLQKQTVEQLVTSRRVDVAILAFWHIAEPLINTIRRLSPDTRVVVDSMDLHFVRHARQAFSEANGGVDERFADEMLRELNVYAAADAVLAVSEKEALLVDDLMGGEPRARFVPDCEELEASPISFEDRRGVIFVGNFEHPPNAQAVHHLLTNIVPRIKPELLAQHPVHIVGRDLDTLSQRYGHVGDAVRMVGWVPDLTPYLQRARVTVVPLLYGAGTKRKLIQALMVGTPAVSTQVGVEGLGVRDGEHVLIADEPDDFAAAVELLLTDRRRWTELARGGRDHVLGLHNAGASRTRLLEALEWALGRSPKTQLLRGPHADVSDNARRYPDRDAYESVVRRIRRIVRQRIPASSTVLVVSRGDPELLELDARPAWHFPRTDDGSYAGHHPADSAVAIEHLEMLKAAGADFVVFPSTSMWWLGHYREFSQHLFSRYPVAYRDDDTCLIFDLRSERGTASANGDRPVARRSRPEISVVIPTRNRAGLLDASLASLSTQTLDRSDFEVIVVDDGSTDGTAEVVNTHRSRLPLAYIAQARQGIAAAKNAGAAAARGDVVLFFDDDDIAHRALLAEHVRAHEEYRDEMTAVLGFTDWHSSLAVTDVMDFVTNVGHYLFAYTGLAEGQRLDHTYFWGGRASCKRSLFGTFGGFRTEFEFGSEDIEFAYRLSAHGFNVVYRPSAKQYMNRAVTFDEFCDRCERQGRSMALFSRMHAAPAVQKYCLVEDAIQKWPSLRPELDERRRRVRELENVASRDGFEADSVRSELHRLYWWCFDASKLKGVWEGLSREAVAVAGVGEVRHG